jgi:hypothetical protein
MNWTEILNVFCCPKNRAQGLLLMTHPHPDRQGEVVVNQVLWPLIVVGHRLFLLKDLVPPALVKVTEPPSSAVSSKNLNFPLLPFGRRRSKATKFEK